MLPYHSMHVRVTATVVALRMRQVEFISLVHFSQEQLERTFSLWRM